MNTLVLHSGRSRLYTLEGVPENDCCQVQIQQAQFVQNMFLPQCIFKRVNVFQVDLILHLMSDQKSRAFQFLETGLESNAVSCTTECGSEVRNIFSFVYHHSKTDGVTLALMSVKGRYFPLRVLKDLNECVRGLFVLSMFRDNRQSFFSRRKALED